jgi:hypothetical protein
MRPGLRRLPARRCLAIVIFAAAFDRLQVEFILSIRPFSFLSKR